MSRISARRCDYSQREETGHLTERAGQKIMLSAARGHSTCLRTRLWRLQVSRHPELQSHRLQGALGPHLVHSRNLGWPGRRPLTTLPDWHPLEDGVRVKKAEEARSVSRPGLSRWRKLA